MTKKTLSVKKSRIAEILNRVSSLTKRKTEKKMEIAAQIKTLLDERHWSQSFLAEKLDKNESEISKWLAGEHNFTIDTICAIEDVLDADVMQVPIFSLGKNYNEFVQPRFVFYYQNVIKTDRIHEWQPSSYENFIFLRTSTKTIEASFV